MTTVNIPIDERGFEVRSFESRLSTEGEKLRGYAVVFNQLSENLGGFVERIATGAFAKSLRDFPDVRALWQHDPAYVLGRTTAGTLAINEDETGLATTIEPPDSTWARDAVISIKRGDVNQMSFAFTTQNDRWDKQDGIWVRTVLEARLFEVSPVTFPAYGQTSIAARSIEIDDPPTQPPPAAQGEEKISGNSRALAHLRRRLTLAEKI